MLDFLKEINKYHLYDRAMDCAIKINTYDCITPIAIFLECTLKAIYIDYNKSASESSVGRITFAKLLSDAKFMNFLQEQYSVSYNSIELITQARKASNKYKHGMHATNIESDVAIDYFEIAYNLAAEYYEKSTGEVAPSWNRKDYLSLVNTAGTEEHRQYASDSNELSKVSEAENITLASDKELPISQNQIAELWDLFKLWGKKSKTFCSLDNVAFTYALTNTNIIIIYCKDEFGQFEKHRFIKQTFHNILEILISNTNNVIDTNQLINILTVKGCSPATISYLLPVGIELLNSSVDNNLL